ncbi:strigolactone esterase D14-like isoform X3 [Arachis stenosperma]|uniref:strigolactone esterase D14-like isoform X3 n=1 Tax=Arachis stenosperma TaxID=217475 RepID=UPI0025AC8CC4|nr:strigolactone esterase D14-like isoform X3 [Arachis stenosperma]
MATPKTALSALLKTRIEGSGSETIVFCHGYGTDQSIWDKVVPILAQNYRVVVFDWPFAGSVKDQKLYDPLKYSSFEAFGDDLITLLTEIGIKSATFVGHSMSGMIGCIASLKRPDLFKRLVLVCASPRFLNSDDFEGGFKNSDVEQLISAMENNYEEFASHFASMIADAANSDNVATVEKYKKGLIKMGAEVALPLAKTVFYSDYRELLDKVETPCTIIQTTNDKAVPRSVALYMQNKIKGEATLEIIHTDGHFPQLTSHLKFIEVQKRCPSSGDFRAVF